MAESAFPMASCRSRRFRGAEAPLLLTSAALQRGRRVLRRSDLVLLRGLRNDVHDFTSCCRQTSRAIRRPVWNALDETEAQSLKKDDVQCSSQICPQWCLMVVLPASQTQRQNASVISWTMSRLTNPTSLDMYARVQPFKTSAWGRRTRRGGRVSQCCPAYLCHQARCCSLPSLECFGRQALSVLSQSI